jgi:hypothetical protein
MDLVSLAPFAATTFDWTLDRGDRSTTVVCKLTFPLEAGTEGSLAPVQEPIAEEDLVPFKGASDVVVTGFAHAPSGGKVRAIQARLVVGDAVNKTLELTGPRAWLADGTASEPSPVDRVPLLWELAAGGPGTANPAGIHANDERAPQIVRAGAPLVRGVAVEPAGFGPIDALSPLRAEKLSGAPAPGAGWRHQPLPWTIDPAYFNVAPLDQRVRAVRTNESILLFGLLAGREKFGMRLPGMQPRAFVQAGREGKEVALVADTVRIDTERVNIVVTWRGQIPPGLVGERVVVGLHERAGRGVWATFAKRLPRGARASERESAAPREPSAPPMVQSPPLPPAPAPAFVPGPPPTPARAPAPGPAPTPARAPAPAFAPAPVLVSAPMPDYIGKRGGAPDVPLEKPSQPAVPVAAPAAPPEPRAPRDILDLLWFEKGLVPRLRAKRPWRAVIDALQLVPANPGASKQAATDADDREEIFQLLANADADEVAAMAEVLARAVSPDGKLIPPLVLVTGEIALPFEPRELLQVTLSAAKPFAATDKAFHDVYEAVAAMNDATALGDTVAHGMTFRVRDAFQQVKHNLGPRYLETTAERALLDTRRYQKRDVFGAQHVLALLSGASGDPVPAYLPAPAATRLPLFARFRVRLVAEVNAQVDSDEDHACALRILAIARVVQRPKASEPKR